MKIIVLKMICLSCWILKGLFCLLRLLSVVFFGLWCVSLIFWCWCFCVELFGWKSDWVCVCLIECFVSLCWLFLVLVCWGGWCSFIVMLRRLRCWCVISLFFCVGWCVLLYWWFLVCIGLFWCFWCCLIVIWIYLLICICLMWWWMLWVMGLMLCCVLCCCLIFCWLYDCCVRCCGLLWWYLFMLSVMVCLNICVILIFFIVLFMCFVLEVMCGVFVMGVRKKWFIWWGGCVLLI